MAELQCSVLAKRKIIPANGGIAQCSKTRWTSRHLSREIL